MTAATPDLFAGVAAPGAAIDAAAKARQVAYLRRVPIKSRGIVAKAFGQACSPRQAIKAKCLDCAGFDREEVRVCRVSVCPLWPLRTHEAGATADPD
jgi:hypothetical protein